LFYYSAHDPFQASDEMTAELKKQYPGKNVSPLASMVGSIDRSVGRIRTALEKKNLQDRTVLFFLGDQGGKIACSAMRGTKKGGQALYEGGARIPFVVSWPGVTRAGSVSPVPVSTVDVLPTILAMAGGDATAYPKLDGKSLVPLLSGEGAIDRKAVVLYRSYEDQYAAVRSGKWKYIAYRRGRDELYDLEADLAEKNDLSAANPEQVASLKSALRAFERKIDVPGVIVK